MTMTECADRAPVHMARVIARRFVDLDFETVHTIIELSKEKD